jgi:hypothetical protein
MHKHLLIALAAVVALGVVSLPAAAAQGHALRFEPKDIEFDKVSGYDVVSLAGCDTMNVPGEPYLPARYINVAIPFGTRVVSARVRASQAIELPGSFNILPAQPYRPLSAGGQPPFLGPKPNVYSSNSQYPGDLVRATGSGSKAGHYMASLAVYPVQYVPAQRKLILYTDIEFDLELADADQASLVVHGRTAEAEKTAADAVRRLVINPEDVDAEAAPSGTPMPLGDTVEYLIVTDPSYVSQFQGLADWKTKKGVPTQVVDTSWIYSNYSGRDNAEKVRNCIKDYYQNKGTLYVLLGGEPSRVPYRIAYAMSSDNGSDLGCDLYYSDLDGDWNADGDSRWGEYPADGIDMYSDVYVGRAPVDTTTEAANFVSKVLTYEGASGGGTLYTDYTSNLLWIAEELWSGVYGSRNKDYIEHFWIPDGFNMTKYYQENGNLTKTNVRNSLNAGALFVNNACHGNTNVISLGNYAWYNSDMNALSNTGRYGAWASISCYVGDMRGDAIAEHWVNDTNGGGIGFEGNDHYGWGSYSGQGPSDEYDERFFKAIFGSDYYHQAQAHGEGKDMLVSSAKGDSYMRYCHYELNMIGDAELPYWTGTPSEITVDHPATLPTGESAFEVHVSSGGADVEGAKVCLWKGDEVYLVDSTGSSGYVTFYPAPSTVGTMYVTVTGENCLPYEGSATVEESQYEWATAPDPEPYGEGALFGAPAGGYPGWVWFSIPLIPADGDPQALLGFDCRGSLWMWDTYIKTTQVYNPPFIDWNLAAGEGYLLRLESGVTNPSYQGADPGSGFEFLMGRQGWTWLGMPATEPLGYPDFMAQVRVQYPVGGAVRTADQDRMAQDPWMTWGWAFWDTYGQNPKTFTPYSPFGANIAYPWLGYRAYVNVGSAQNAAEPDQVTLLWP